MLEITSKLYQPTMKNLAWQASSIAICITQLQRRSRSDKFVLVAMDSASESILTLLAEA